jgi:hypothetical protein
LGKERTGIFLREGLDTGVAKQPVRQIRKRQNLLFHPALRYLQSSAAKRQDLCEYKWAAQLTFDGEHTQIEVLELRPVNVRL